MSLKEGEELVRFRFIILMTMVLSLVTFCTTKTGAEANPTEIRGVWLTNVDSRILDSRASIAEAMEFLARHHFNVVFPVVWNDAKTLYPSAVMDSLFGIPIDPRYEGRDPLAELIEEAHRWNIAVIPWFEYGFSSSYKKDGGVILAQKPEWAAKDRDGNLMTKNGFEWMNAYHPEVQKFIRLLVLEVVKKYDIEGVQGDDRLPAQPIEGGYSAYTRNRYAVDHEGNQPPDDYRDPEWQRWRANILNDFGRELYTQVKAIKPDVLVSWAPSVYPWSYDEYLQDWPAWIRDGYADYVFPQCYRYEFEQYKYTIEMMMPGKLGIDADRKVLFPGVLMNVGAYVMSADYLSTITGYNRAQGFAGEVFFFYEGLRKNNDQLAELLLRTEYRKKADLPFAIHRR